LAITKTYIKDNGISNIKVGDRSIMISYFPEYETIVAFERSGVNQELQINEIDIHGNTPEYGKLERIYIYNSVLWAVWAQYYPDSEVLQ
jgi:hypothetical protein